jgi:hypothetical protein
MYDVVEPRCNQSGGEVDILGCLSNHLEEQEGCKLPWRKVRKNRTK